MQSDKNVLQPPIFRLGLLAALLLVMTVVAYLPVTRCGFIWDDDDYVQNNLTLRSADGLRQIWFEVGATRQYYPMVHTSFWIEYHLWKLNPAGYHIVNILLHAIGAVLLWRVLAVLKLPGAWVIAAVFALHPVQVESVAWITERKNVLSAVFYLGSALAYLRYAISSTNDLTQARPERLYTISLVLFAFALLSKTVTCTLPVVLLLILWWKRGKIGFSEVRDLTKFFIFGIVLGLLTVWMEKRTVGAVGQEWDLSLIERFLIAGRALCFYVGKLLWPNKLTFIYPRWDINSAVWYQYLYPVAAVAVLAVFWLGRKRIGSGPLVAIIYFACTLFPALGFFDVFPMRYSYVADHFQYLAGIGIISLVVSAGFFAVHRLDKWIKTTAAVALVLVLATLGSLTWQQCRIYKNLETLWRDTIPKNPNSWMPRYNLGNLLKRRNDLDEAISHYRRSLQINPGHAQTHNNLGLALKSQGKFDEAISHYRQALCLEPNNAFAHANFARILIKHPDPNLHKANEAIDSAEQAAELTSYRHPIILTTLAEAYAAAGQFDQAIKTAQSALGLATAASDDKLANYLRDQIALFKQGQYQPQLTPPQ